MVMEVEVVVEMEMVRGEFHGHPSRTHAHVPAMTTCRILSYRMLRCFRDLHHARSRVGSIILLRLRAWSNRIPQLPFRIIAGS